jgi:hypothetical protein
MPAMLLKVIAEWRNRVETIFAEITDGDLCTDWRPAPRREDRCISW